MPALALLHRSAHPPSYTPAKQPARTRGTRCRAAGHPAFFAPSPSAAWAALLAFTAADAAGKGSALVATRGQREQLKAALLAAASTPNTAAGWEPPSPSSGAPPRLLLGVLASSTPVAARALRDYCIALGVAYAPPPSTPAAGGGVYLKWRPGPTAPPEEEQGAGRAPGTPAPTPLVSASPYAGADRGVLVTLGTQQFGHLPLGLIDEDRQGPPPALG
jgi:hypothetical protein